MNSFLYKTVITDKSHRKVRRKVGEVADIYSGEQLEIIERVTRRFEYICRMESPVFLEQERICFTRTVANIPEIFTEEEHTAYVNSTAVHEQGCYTNLSADYEKILKNGILCLKDGADEYTCRVIDALLELVERYQVAAELAGLHNIAENLKRVPAHGAQNFEQALQSVRIINFALWIEGNTHNTLGRFDQYLYPYLAKDIADGKLNRELALDLVEEFFLSLNRDNDLYPGVQQGDNGQSLMLAGRTKDGSYGYNLLSELCLEASRNLRLIDPKINIRVDKNTPDEVFTKCSELTKVGLGFPQYSNDDVVIPGLVALGYDLQDAVDYTVAACWEFIIPKVAFDVPNIDAISFPAVVDTVLHSSLDKCNSMEDFLAAVRIETKKRFKEIQSKFHNVRFIKSPLLHRLMDFENGPKYQNFGIHGVGLSCAADSLASIDKHIFTDHDVTPDRLVAAMDNDFADDPELLHLLRYESPKLGCNSPLADSYLEKVLDIFADTLKGEKNCFGGIWRAGTGSAMYYLWLADEIGASPDGRRKGEAFGANYSISLFARPDGPFSVIRSMTKPDLTKTINGGPLTLEFHESMFKTPESTAQIGQFVKQFVLMGGHQLQLNAVNAETLKDAQVHPENYPQLIVRVWGWSAYFVELDKVWQDHVISRQEYTL